jgi:hypothetical protein
MQSGLRRWRYRCKQAQLPGEKEISMFFRRFAALTVSVFILGLMPLAANVSNGLVTPSSVTFTSSNPAGSVTGAPASTNVSFKTTLNPASFTVHVKAVTSGFTGCHTPPATAVTVSCSAGSNITCGGAAALSNTGNGTTVATGSGSHTSVSLVITYNFQDSWKYQQGASCSISVQVLYTEP